MAPKLCNRRYTVLFMTLLLVASILVGCQPSTVLVSEGQAAAALDEARKHLGSPYVYGARGPNEFDSSGIITYAYRRVIPNVRFRIGSLTATDASHADIYRWGFHPLPLEDIRPGDLVYITDGSADVTHGAMFVRWVEPYTLMEFLDASTRLGEIVIQEWPVDEEVRGQRFVAAGRLKVVR